MSATLSNHEVIDVAVVGGGPAGLVVANAISRARKGLKVQVSCHFGCPAATLPGMGQTALCASFGGSSVDSNWGLVLKCIS
jgi:succinate dehydrogenase/fumarate reductase flavoprotein subunit